MSRSELAVIAELERLCFEDCWSEKAAADTLAREDVVFGIEYDGDSPAGYFIGSASLGEAELYRIAVVPDKRGKGLGKRLMKRFFESCPKDTKRFFLEVRAGNTAALGLYERFGFKRIYVRKGYYGDEDGVVMERGSSLD